ncbi:MULTISPECIES: hypothetical protein [Vibrio]|uniref:hypothetical protein n=1 Tax=Vibrio TaxID=662 RepID=UPI0002F7FC4C|nr:hypothetical protein [Vibrio tasmaniensis]
MCGPYCLVACFHALELLPLESPIELHKFNKLGKKFNGDVVTLDHNHSLLDLASELYSITGIITTGKTPDYIEHSGYNSLGAMLYVIEKVGLNSEVIIENNQILIDLNEEFPIEFELIKDLKVPIRILDEQESTLNETILISVLSVNGSLHYVINNSSGEWLDTDIENGNTNWDFIEKWNSTSNKREGADWVGVSIRVSR